MIPCCNHYGIHILNVKIGADYWKNVLQKLKDHFFQHSFHSASGDQVSLALIRKHKTKLTSEWFHKPAGHEQQLWSCRQASMVPQQGMGGMNNTRLYHLPRCPAIWGLSKTHKCIVHEDREKNWQPWKSAEAIKLLLFQEAKPKKCTCVLMRVKACASVCIKKIVCDQVMANTRTKHHAQCQLWRVCTVNHKPQNTHTHKHTHAV